MAWKVVAARDVQFQVAAPVGSMFTVEFQDRREAIDGDVTSEVVWGTPSSQTIWERGQQRCEAMLSNHSPRPMTVRGSPLRSEQGRLDSERQQLAAHRMCMLSARAVTARGDA